MVSITAALVLFLVVIFTCFKCLLFITLLLDIVYVVFYPKISVLNIFVIIHRHDEIDVTLKLAFLGPGLWTVFCSLSSLNF